MNLTMQKQMNDDLVEKLMARVTELELEVAVVRQKAERDPLTGCLRREALFGLLDSRRDFGILNKHNTVIVIDVDHFKMINDTHGHLVGDRALELMGRVLQRELPEGALLARIGGEEFAVIMDVDAQHQAHDAQEAAEEIRKAIESAQLKLNLTQSLSMTASLGIASWDTDLPLIEALARADEALYRAKRGGRNQVAA